jgi:serine protease Do
VRPNDTLKALQERYVRLRIVDMASVDAGLFEFDFDLTFAVFVLNHEKNIYLRYGGRIDSSADHFLTEASLFRALETGVDLHERWKKGMTVPAPAASRMVQSYPKLKKLAKEGQCIHCHQIANEQSKRMVSLADFNKKTDPWPYPNPRTLGLILDPDEGNVLTDADGPALAAGLKKGDAIARVANRSVYTFADLQYALHNLDKSAKSVPVRISGSPESITIDLPEHWRVTDINRRSIGHRMTPFPEFWAKTLTPEAKKEAGLKTDGFASEVTKFWANTNGKKAGLRPGDIVYSINGVETSPLARNAMIYIRTHFNTGDAIEVRYRRGEHEKKTTFKLRAKPW